MSFCFLLCIASPPIPTLTSPLLPYPHLFRSVKAVRATLAEIGTPPHETVFVSGIGCAARFPYYMATCGFHTIHGRAPALATGLKLANPNLNVWVIRSEEHTSELQSLMRSSYAVFCLKKKKKRRQSTHTQ